MKIILDNICLYINILTKKSLRKIVSYRKSIFFDERPTSYPFISGDTFRSVCDIIVENNVDLDNFINKIEFNYQSIKNIYMPIYFLNSQLNKIIIQMISVKDNLKKINLIIHNGDTLPDESSLNNLSKIFNKVYCVNIIKQRENIYPLPIGIENYRYFKNGKLENFIKFKSKINYTKKNIIIFSCFDISTNHKIRSQVFKDLQKSRFKDIHNSLSISEYQNKLVNSYFVISPPGNGSDCHRTWEAIYFNCIPIVLNNYLAKEFCDTLPILAVDSYSFILSMSDNELINIYNELINKRDKKMAFFDYWKKRINQ